MDSIGEFFPVLIEQTGAVIPPMLKCLLLFPQNLLVSLVELLNFLLVLQLVFCALTYLFYRLSFSSCRVIMLYIFFTFSSFQTFSQRWLPHIHSVPFELTKAVLRTPYFTWVMYYCFSFIKCSGRFAISKHLGISSSFNIGSIPRPYVANQFIGFQPHP